MDYKYARKQVYSNSYRDSYVQFIEHIHDIVRCGEVERLSSPLSAFWAITNSCNLSCKHCYNVNAINTPSKILDLETNKHIVDMLMNVNIGEIVLEGGEPTLYPYFVELVRYIRAKDIPLTIITNGTLINNTMAQCLNNCLGCYDVIQISIDGNEASCNTMRGLDIYSKVKNSLSLLHKCNIVINCVVTNETIESISEMCDDLYSFHNIIRVHLSPLMQLGNGSTLKPPDPENAKNTLLKIKNKYGSWVSGTTYDDSFYLKKESELLIGMKTVKLGCCAGRSKIYINPEGIVYPCEFYKTNELLSVFVDDINHIWKNNWIELSRLSQKKSNIMKTFGKYLNFCPNIGV